MSRHLQKTFITAASAIFPSGPGMVLATIALQTQMALNRKHPFYVDSRGEPIKASFFPEPAQFDIARWLELAKAALQDLHKQLPVPQARQRQQAINYSLWLVLPPEARAGVPAKLAEQLIQACQNQPFRFSHTQIVTGDHCAAVYALAKACDRLNVPRPKQHLSGPLVGMATAKEVAIVLALDSWLHPEALGWLESQDLLHGAGKPYRGETYRNPYGRIPGEAAAAVMLSSDGPGWCQVKGLALADEPIVRTDPRPCVGVGWTQAAQQALSTLPKDQKITHVFSDLNGEPYRADQFGFACLRLSGSLQDNWGRYTPATVCGDVGTANSLVHMALSASLLRQPEAKAQAHLLLASSDDARRSAVVLSTSRPPAP